MLDAALDGCVIIGLALVSSRRSDTELGRSATDLSHGDGTGISRGGMTATDANPDTASGAAGVGAIIPPSGEAEVGPRNGSSSTRVTGSDIGESLAAGAPQASPHSQSPAHPEDMPAGEFVLDRSGRGLARVRQATARSREKMKAVIESAKQVAEPAAQAAQATGAARAAPGGRVSASSAEPGFTIESSEDFLERAGRMPSMVGSQAFAHASDAYDMSRENLAVAMAATVSVSVKFWDTMKIEIFRDVYQTLSLFFSSIASGGLGNARTVWGNLAGAISMDLTFLFPSISLATALGLASFVGFVLLVGFLWMLYTAFGIQPNEIRHGHEAETWDALRVQKKTTVSRLGWILTVAITVYLPVSKLVIEVFACDGSIGTIMNNLDVEDQSIRCEPVETSAGTRYDCRCSDYDGWRTLQTTASFLFIFFTLVLPIICYKLIQDNKPVGSRDDPDKRYDDAGNLVEYTNDMYQEDLKTDPRQVYSPYLFLYDGYERKWAPYKVIVMVFKFVLILPLVLAWKSPLTQCLIALVILCIFAGLSFYSSPFINRQSDQIDASGRVNAVFTVFFGMIATKEVAGESASTAMAILINIVNAINFLIIVVLSLYSLPRVRRHLKNLSGQFSFSDAAMNQWGSVDAIAPEWNLMRQLKVRVWMPFWESLLLNLPEDGEAAAESARIAMRFIEKKSKVAQVGRHRVVAHFEALEDPERTALFRWVQSHLEGVDVFWNGTPFSGALKSRTCFGKMYVEAFPFTCVVVYDDSDDHAFIYGYSDEFVQLVEKNREPEIERRRHVRRCLRALDEQRIHLVFDMVVTKTVRDGYKTDSDGNRTEQYSEIKVNLHFTSGRFFICAETSKPMAAGFKVFATFDDGCGSGRAPRTGEVHYFRNETTTLNADELDINANYAVQGRLQELLEDGHNAAIIQVKYPEFERELQEYRNDMIRARIESESVLSNAFYLHVYDAFGIPRPALESYLRQIESSELIRSIPDRHAGGLDLLYARVNYVQSHPCAAFWFVFFEDVWSQNKEMKVFKGKNELFDPRYSTALCYRPMPRDKLVKILDDEGLRRADSFFSRHALFTDHILDVLYEEMDRRASTRNPLNDATGRRGSIMNTFSALGAAMSRRASTRTQANTSDKDPAASRRTSVRNPLHAMDSDAV